MARTAAKPAARERHTAVKLVEYRRAVEAGTAGATDASAAAGCCCAIFRQRNKRNSYGVLLAKRAVTAFRARVVAAPLINGAALRQPRSSERSIGDVIGRTGRTHMPPARRHSCLYVRGTVQRCRDAGIHSALREDFVAGGGDEDHVLELRATSAVLRHMSPLVVPLDRPHCALVQDWLCSLRSEAPLKIPTW